MIRSRQAAALIPAVAILALAGGCASRSDQVVGSTLAPGRGATVAVGDSIGMATFMTRDAMIARGRLPAQSQPTATAGVQSE